MSYNDIYRKTPEYFGAEPAELLIANYHLIEKTKPVLDLGAGQGRNSIFIARQGYGVDAVEPSRVGVDIISEMAAREKLKIRTYCSRFEDFVPADIPYGAIMLFGLIQLLIAKIKRWTSPGDLILLSAFTTDDPRYEPNAAEMEAVGHNSFRTSGGEYRTFLEPGEILTLFRDFQAVYHWEGMGPEHHHGGKAPHRHATVNAIFKR
jgi:SAM-dependent methyltransferase